MAAESHNLQRAPGEPVRTLEIFAVPPTQPDVALRATRHPMIADTKYRGQAPRPQGKEHGFGKSAEIPAIDDAGFYLAHNVAKHPVIVALVIFEPLDGQPRVAKHAVNFQTAMHLRFTARGNILHLMIRSQDLHFVATGAQALDQGLAMQLIPPHIMRRIEIADDQNIHGAVEALSGGVCVKAEDGWR